MKTYRTIVMVMVMVVVVVVVVVLSTDLQSAFTLFVWKI
jgi:hypothetical protein